MHLQLSTRVREGCFGALLFLTVQNILLIAEEVQKTKDQFKMPKSLLISDPWRFQWWSAE